MKAIKIFVAVILTITTIAVIIPANLAEASGMGKFKIDDVEAIKKDPARGPI